MNQRWPVFGKKSYDIKYDLFQTEYWKLREDMCSVEEFAEIDKVILGS